MRFCSEYPTIVDFTGTVDYSIANSVHNDTRILYNRFRDFSVKVSVGNWTVTLTSYLTDLALDEAQLGTCKSVMGFGPFGSRMHATMSLGSVIRLHHALCSLFSCRSPIFDKSGSSYCGRFHYTSCKHPVKSAVRVNIFQNKLNWPTINFG